MVQDASTQSCSGDSRTQKLKTFSPTSLKDIFVFSVMPGGDDCGGGGDDGDGGASGGDEDGDGGNSVMLWTTTFFPLLVASS